MSIGTATESDKRLLAWINLPADQRYESSPLAKQIVFTRLCSWAERVGATEEEFEQVRDSLNL